MKEVENPQLSSPELSLATPDTTSTDAQSFRAKALDDFLTARVASTMQASGESSLPFGEIPLAAPGSFSLPDTRLVDIQSQNQMLAPEMRQLADLPAPRVDVRALADLQKEGQSPDIYIRANGQIEVLGDPKQFLKDKVTLSFEPSGDNQNAMNAIQERVIDTVSRSLKEKNPFFLSLMMEDGQKGLDPTNAPLPDSPVMRGPGNLQFPGLNPSSYTGGGYEGRQAGRTDSSQQTQDVSDNTATTTQAAPEHGYFAAIEDWQRNAIVKNIVKNELPKELLRAPDSITYNDNVGFQVGTYGLTWDAVSSWLEDVDIAQMEQLEAKGKVKKGTSAKIAALKKAHKEGTPHPLLDKLKGKNKGNAVSKEELNEFLPTEIQEIAANHRLSTLAREIKAQDGTVDAGKLTVSLLNGKLLSKEEATTVNDALSGINSHAEVVAKTMLEASQRNTNGSRTEEAPHELGKRLAEIARDYASKRNETRNCLNGVAETLDKIGIHMPSNSDTQHATDSTKWFDSHPRFTEIPMNQVKAGDIVVRGAAPGHESGHIFVYLGNGEEASDHVQTLTPASAYGPSRAYRVMPA